MYSMVSRSEGYASALCQLNIIKVYSIYLLQPVLYVWTDLILLTSNVYSLHILQPVLYVRADLMHT